MLDLPMTIVASARIWLTLWCSGVQHRPHAFDVFIHTGILEDGSLPSRSFKTTFGVSSVRFQIGNGAYI